MQGLYLIGLCHLRNAVRTFAVDRIRSCSVLNERFPPPEDFNMDDYLQTAFRIMTGDPETITVRFASEVSHVVRERIWHPTQEIREETDGSLVVTLQVPINHEITSWILGFGSTAQVLQPEVLRTRILGELLMVAKTYQDFTATPEALAKIIGVRLS